MGQWAEDRSVFPMALLPQESFPYRMGSLKESPVDPSCRLQENLQTKCRTAANPTERPARFGQRASACRYEA